MEKFPLNNGCGEIHSRVKEKDSSDLETFKKKKKLWQTYECKTIMSKQIDLSVTAKQLVFCEHHPDKPNFKQFVWFDQTNLIFSSLFVQPDKPNLQQFVCIDLTKLNIFSNYDRMQHLKSKINAIHNATDIKLDSLGKV